MDIPYGYILFIHQLMDIWFVSTFLAYDENATMKTHVQVFVWLHVFISLGYMPRVKLLGPEDCFHTASNVLDFHQQCMIDLISPHPCQNLLTDFDYIHTSECKVISHCTFDAFFW